ncbi:MAG: hypothetical protein ACE361_06055 [Aureliella sp.]
MKELPFKVDSAHTKTTAKTRVRRVRWWLIATILVTPLAVLWLAWFGFRIGWTWRENDGRAQMAVRLQELSERGIPADDQSVQQHYSDTTSVANLEEWYEVFGCLQDDGFLSDFAGVRYIDASVEVDEFADPFPIGDAWESASAAVAATEKHRDAIEKIRRLASSELPVRFPFFFQATETLLPELQESRGMARLLFCDAQVAVHLGDAERAAKDIVALGELAKHAEAIPFGIARVVGIAYRREALKAMQAAIRIDLFDQKQLQLLDSYCSERTAIGTRWQDMILGEMSVHMSVFTNPAVAMKSASPIPARGHDAVYYIDLMQRAADVDTLDFISFHSAAAERLAEVEDDSSNWLETADRILSRLLAPPFSSYAELLINDCLQHRLARLAIASRLYERKEGKLPDRLQVLPEKRFVIAPLRKQRFGFRRTQHGVTLWGLHFSAAVQKVAERIPDQDGATVKALNNRAVVWYLDD